MDAYGNVITYNGTELEPKETDIKCDRSELITGMSTIDSFKNLDGTTVTTYIDTVYRTFYKSSGSASSSTGTLAGELLGLFFTVSEIESVVGTVRSTAGLGVRLNQHHRFQRLSGCRLQGAAGAAAGA